jgi:hypothetical protein
VTTFQQALVHLALVVVAVVAVVVLATTGNLTSEALTILLAVTGLGSVGVAGVTPTATTTVPLAVPTASVVRPPG